ncbi:hypothetical protein Rleg9DRAFT_2587 [Rhizobium leguminosarum bv. trifolii WSM597]|uniref:Lipoprotein n=1 Tax=Rhizobium leguminosarum bv. trifolii WSM597 TaxID=754764 RepID=J0H159_RHILT|nr:hypothetical protein [Rhizobium leguminosarum]EJB03750.1 hypothetical protein Rleg9DRAFT_2587 [Rhizobium leguminosarum bv. trifolii WSM597]
MRAKLVVVAAFSLVLASCQDRPIDELSYSELKSLSLELHKRCWAQGVKSDTPEMKMCLQQEFTRESSIRSNNLQARQAMGEALIAGGQGYNQGLQQQPSYRPMNCTSTPTSTWVGGPVRQVRTSCY